MNAKNKIAVVTGGSRGIGKYMVLGLAKKGIDIVLTYNRNKEAAEHVVAEIQSLGQKAVAFQLDSGKVQSFEKFIQQVTDHLNNQNGSPNFDFLINNAGTPLYSHIVTTTEEQLDSIFNIHYKGVFFLTQKALSFLNNGGCIVNISAQLVRITMPGFSVYASMKAAIESLTTYLAKELGPRKIRANAVAPGAIETDFGGGQVKNNKELNDHIASVTALGRVGLPSDIGGVVAFLCSDDAYWVNAQCIEVSGGQTL
jgi:NAD(P)-dependent dehydrogenase (short-subunit alcohol dehydrogenase family)